MKEALFYKKLKSKVVQCQLCPNFCIIKENFIGKCKVRKNINGKLYSLSYGKPVAIHLDPIEKKPLYHFLPKTFTFSIGMAGCNLSCPWCQNFSISQESPKDFKTKYISPKKLIEEALKSGCPSISYTYTEPLVSLEYVCDVASLAKKKGLCNVLVTNGYFTPESLQYLSGLIDAVNVDLKSFNDKVYTRYCGAKLKNVLENIKYFYNSGVHIEITTLIIPEINDSEKELTEIARFIASVSKDIPWHISRFFPMFKMLDKQITPISTLKMAEKIGKKAGLKYVYVGNV